MKYRAQLLTQKGGWAVKRMQSHTSHWLSKNNMIAPNQDFWWDSTRYAKIMSEQEAKDYCRTMNLRA